MKRYTEENSVPGTEEPTSYLGIISEIGKKMEEIAKLLNYDGGWAAAETFDHRNHITIGALPIYYEQELVGYIKIDDGWASFAKPEFKTGT